MPHAHVIQILPVLHPAGAERIVAELARRLPHRGFTTSVICLEDERAAVGNELMDQGIRVVGLQKSRFNTLGCALSIRRHLPQVRPLILHAHLHHANIATRLAARRLRGRQREGVHVLSTIHVIERRFRPWQFLLDRLTARHARAEICVSRAVASFQQARTKLPSDFFRVIENGIDVDRFTPPQQSRARGMRVVSVGRLNVQKDFPTLLRAWQQVERQVPQAGLILAGSGPEEQRLRRLAGRLGLQRVEFLGFVDDVPDLLRQGDVYVQPSAWEGFGLAVAEAMASGLPPVVTDVDSLPEVVAHGRTGLVVPPHDPPALAAAIADLLHHPERAATLGAAAREEAVQRFSIQRMITDYARLYQDLLRDQS